MPEKAWKRHERRVAEKLGVRRNPNNGAHQSDIDAGPFSIEHKKRKHLPRLLTDAMTQAEIGAAEKARTPVVILTGASRGHPAESYVCMKFEDWLDWYGPAVKAPADRGTE